MSETSWEWISTESPPVEGNQVLIHVPAWGKVLYTGYYNQEDGWHDMDGELLEGHNKPTYWVSLNTAIQNIPYIAK
jgi:hypothetical protein